MDYLRFFRANLCHDFLRSLQVPFSRLWPRQEDKKQGKPEESFLQIPGAIYVTHFSRRLNYNVFASTVAIIKHLEIEE